MKKNTIIIFFLLTTIVSVIYGYSQKLRADQYRELADKQSLLEEKLMEQLRLQTAMAEEQHRMAEQQRIIAERNMQEAMAQRTPGKK
jgi:hypothetical protein